MRYNGKDFMIRVGGKTIALATSCSLNVTSQFDETKTKDDPIGPGGEFKHAEWNVSTENLVGCDTNIQTQMVAAALLEAQLAGTLLDVEFRIMQDTEGGVPEGDWQPQGILASMIVPNVKGKAMVESFTNNAPNEGKATLSVSFKGMSRLEFINTPD